MKKQSPGYTSDFLHGRAAIIELVAAGVILALAIELAANSLMSLMNLGDWWTLLSGGILGAIALFLLFRRYVHAASRRSSLFDGVIVYLRDTNAIVDIPRYDYGSELHKYLHAAFTENPALKTLWDKEPLSGAFTFDNEKGAMTRVSSHSLQLIREATEYYILSRLSTHLTDYFNDDEFEKDRLKEYAREDVPEIMPVQL